MPITGATVHFATKLSNPDTGAPEDAKGAITMLLTDPDGAQTTVAAVEVTHDGTGDYHHDRILAVDGLWHWEWLVAGQSVDQGTVEMESESAEGEEPDLTDLKVLVPRARRKIEGPWGNANGRPPLANSQIYAMIADACSEVIMLSGSFFHHTLLVKKRDPLGGYPTEWKTDQPLEEYESAIICAQVALTYYFQLFRDMKISESIKNEGTEWTWELSANVVRSYLQSIIDERDKAIAGLRINLPVLDVFASNIRVRDQQTVAVLEWWAGQYDHGTGGGLPGGQEAAVVPVFYPPGVENP